MKIKIRKEFDYWVVLIPNNWSFHGYERRKYKKYENALLYVRTYLNARKI